MDELKEYKSSYAMLASTIPELKDKTNEWLMVELSSHINSKSRYRDVVFAMLMVRYWHLLKQYTHKSTTVAEWQDVHDWLVDTITYIAQQRAWESEGSSLRSRKNWADSAVNTRMKCTRINAYQASNRDKRCLDFTSGSFEGMEEEYGDAFHQNFAEDPSFINDDDAYTLIKKYIERQEYFTALVVDAVVNHNVVDYNQDGTSVLSQKKLKKHLFSIGKEFEDYLVEEYDNTQLQVRYQIFHEPSSTNQLVHLLHNHNL